MKKFFTFLAGAIALASVASSCGTSVSMSKIGEVEPALVGVWVSENFIDNASDTTSADGTGITCDRYTFNADGTFTQEGYLKMEMRDSTEVTNIDISFSGAGYYGIADGKINFKFNAKDGKSTLDRFDMVFLDGTSESDTSMAKSILNFLLVRPLVSTMKKTMKKDQIYILNSLSADSFEMTNSSSSDSTPTKYIKQQ